MSIPVTETPAAREGGFTLVEMMIVLVISLVVFGGFTLAVTDAVDFSVHGVGAADLQEIGRTALDQIKRDLQSTGRFMDADLALLLPHVFSNGQPDPAMDPAFLHDTAYLGALAATFPTPPPWPTPASPPPFVAPGSEIQPLGIRECVFRLPQDLDGDGRIVSAATGEIEWGEELFGYVLVPNARGTLDLVRRRVDDAGVVTDETICRCVEALTFDSVDTKNILPLDAVEVHLHLRRVTTRGETQRLHLATTLAMRNS
jgi:prepilin-type N-terminal cleavage/methylation domain-containing protein